MDYKNETILLFEDFKKLAKKLHDICESIKENSNPEIKIEESGLPTRIINILKKQEIYNLNDLSNFDKKEISYFLGLGKESYAHLMCKLDDYGIETFGKVCKDYRNEYLKWKKILALHRAGVLEQEIKEAIKYCDPWNVIQHF